MAPAGTVAKEQQVVSGRNVNDTLDGPIDEPAKPKVCYKCQNEGHVSVITRLRLWLNLSLRLLATVRARSVLIRMKKSHLVTRHAWAFASMNRAGTRSRTLFLGVVES